MPRSWQKRAAPSPAINMASVTSARLASRGSGRIITRPSTTRTLTSGRSSAMDPSRHPPGVEALGQCDHGGKGGLPQPAIGLVVGQALRANPGAVDLDPGQFPLRVATQRKRQGRRDGLQPQPQTLGHGQGEHVDHPLRQIEVAPAGARLPLNRPVDRDQGGDVRHVDPQAVPVQAQGVIRVLIALIVDGVGGQVGEIQPVFIR